MSINAARRSKKFKNFRLRMWLIKPHFCYICGFPIPDNTSHHDPLHYQLDHVIPLKIYPEGLYEEDNVMLTHQLCNKKKGDRRISIFLQEECQREVAKILKLVRNTNEDNNNDIPLDDSGLF